MKAAVTMADVAREAGVSKSTVSLALGGSPLIPDVTQSKVKAAAERLGYQRDPLLSALSAYRRKGQQVSHHGAIALVTAATELESKRTYVPTLWRAAKAAAVRLGYSSDEYVIDASSPGMRRMGEIMQTRGVVAVVFGSRIQPVWIEEFPWDRFAAVTVARSNAHYPLHIINSDFTSAVLETWRRIAAGPYRRVAVLIRRWMDHSLGWRLSLLWRGLNSEAPERFADDAVQHYEGVPLSGDLSKWLRATKPDILVVDTEDCFRAVCTMVPKACELVVIGLRTKTEAMAGIYHPVEALAEVALLKLDGMIRAGERGLAVKRQITLVEGQWLSGVSAPHLG